MALGRGSIVKTTETLQFPPQELINNKELQFNRKINSKGIIVGLLSFNEGTTIFLVHHNEDGTLALYSSHELIDSRITLTTSHARSGRR